jgi:xanthine dehydrogenase YagS FAD-binding subunit
MRPFELSTVVRAEEAVRLASYDDANVASVHAPHLFLAGGTTVLDLMKIDVMRPERLVDLGPLRHQLSTVQLQDATATLGAMVTMAEAAAHPLLAGALPVLVQSLEQAASPQLRNMATLGGNLLQRTRCPYFRDVRNVMCNKRSPGTGCAARDGIRRRLAVLGTSEHCIANYPGDLAVALVALDAEVVTQGADGAERRLLVDDLHRLPGDTPHLETQLRPGELVTAIRVPMVPWMQRSLYLKVRDRASYDFALASAAIALDLDREGIVREARIGLGGVASKPWRARSAEAWLVGRRLDDASARGAADEAFAEADGTADAEAKPEIGRRTLTSALLRAAALEVTAHG